MQSVALTSEEMRKLLSCGCNDAVSLYLYRKADRPLETALDALHFTAPQMMAATDCLRQLGLWDNTQRPPVEPEKPDYTEADVAEAIRTSKGEFSKLIGETQRRLGRTLSTEELKTLLSFTDYLRLPTEVVGIMLSYCVERARRRGVRAPSIRSVEKEAYRWADEGIDTLEVAAFYVQQQLEIHNRIASLRKMLQIDQRRLTATEEQHIASWVKMGFPDDVIHLAFERTCVNTGGLKWNYMNSILKSWHEKNLHTLQQIQSGDAPKQMYQRHDDAPSPLEQKAIALALAEGEEG